MSNVTKKPTKKQMFESLKAQFALSPEQTAFIDHEIELLAKRSSGERTQTPRQKENDGLKVAILSAMEDNVVYTIGELWKTVPELKGNPDMSSQRVSAIVSQMVDAGTVVRTEDKRKAYFSKVVEVEA